MPEDKGNEEHGDDYSQQWMQEGVRDVKKRSTAERSEVGTIENEDSRNHGEEPASPPAARAFVFHSLLVLP
jgi:hypothetical protein